MKRYYLEVPYTGVLKVEVKANSKDEALEKVYETGREEMFDGKHEDIEFLECEEDYSRIIVEGNVFHGIQNRMVIEEIEEED